MADGPDVLIWRMVADSTALAVGATRGLCVAAEHHESARPIAEKRVATLRTMGAMLMACADDFDSILAGQDDRSLDEIVSQFADRFGKGLDEQT